MSFILFGNVLHRKQTNHRPISVPRFSMMTTEVNPYSQNYSSLNCTDASVCYYLQFPKESSMHGKRQRPREIKHFPYWYFFFFSQYEEYNLLLPLLRNGCCLIDPFAFWRFYKVLHGSIAWFWKYSNKLWRCSKPLNLWFWNMKYFQKSILIKRTASPTTKVEVN